MKQIIEFLPIILFASTYFYTSDIYLATLVLLVALFCQVCLEYFLKKKISQKTLIVFIISLLFCGTTLVFRNEEFLFWRSTVINWIFSILLFSFTLFTKKNLLKMLLSKSLLLPDKIWHKLSLGWSLFFFLLGLLNILVAYNFSLDIWVNYKLFGGVLITLVFFIITIIYLLRGGYLNKK